MSNIINIIGIVVCLFYVVSGILSLILWACAVVAEKLLAILDEE